MELWNHRGKQNSITAALQLSIPEHAVISITGAGGKTSLMLAWAREFAATGKRTVITTTTHMFHPSHIGAVSIRETGSEGAAGNLASVVFSDAYKCAAIIYDPACGTGYSGSQSENSSLSTGLAELAGRILNEEGFVIVVSDCPEDGRKVTAPPACVMDHLCNTADVVLTEADGSRNMPLKWPAPWEPAVPDNTDITVCVAGLSSLGRRVSEVMYRADHLPEGWKRDKVDDVLIRAVLASGEGGLKGARGEFRVFMNQADACGSGQSAARLQMMLAVSGIQSAWGILKDQGPCAVSPCQAQV